MSVENAEKMRKMKKKNSCKERDDEVLASKIKSRMEREAKKGAPIAPTKISLIPWYHQRRRKSTILQGFSISLRSWRSPFLLVKFLNICQCTSNS